MMAKRVANKSPDTAVFEDIIVEAACNELKVTIYLIGSSQTVDGYIKATGGCLWLKDTLSDGIEYDILIKYDQIAAIATVSPIGTITDLDQ